MKTGVIIGRFQVPYLHSGHRKLLYSVCEKVDKLVVLLGSTVKPDLRNLLPFNIREEMIMEDLSDYGGRIQIEIHEIIDHQEDDHWSQIVDEILSRYENVILYGSRDCFHTHYSGVHPFEEIEEIPGESGTDMREHLYEGIESMGDFRAGMMCGIRHMLTQN